MIPTMTVFVIAVLVWLSLSAAAWIAYTRDDTILEPEDTWW